MIILKHLYKSFEGGDVVLKDISTEFLSGKINQIIGQSGSGKTVLLKCSVGLMSPDSGDIEYDGRLLNNMKKKDRLHLCQEIGMLFQASALFDYMTIEENVLFPLQMFSGMTDSDQLKRAHYCLDEVGLPNSYQLFPNELSGGMQKRAAIARAIALNPKYLFCDEPNSGLDPLTAIKIDELILHLTKTYQMTTVINTHDINSVMTIGEHIVYLDKGYKEWEGSKDELFLSGNDSLNRFLFSSHIFNQFQDELIKQLLQKRQK